jgi:hypothetical protein
MNFPNDESTSQKATEQILFLLMKAKKGKKKKKNYNFIPLTI